MGKVGKDHSGSSGPTSLLKQGHPAQNCIKMVLEFISDLPVFPPGLVFLFSVKTRQAELQIRKSSYPVLMQCQLQRSCYVLQEVTSLTGATTITLLLDLSSLSKTARSFSNSVTSSNKLPVFVTGHLYLHILNQLISFLLIQPLRSHISTASKSVSSEN